MEEKMLGVCRVLMLLFLVGNFLGAQDEADADLIAGLEGKLQKIIALQGEIADIHPLLANLFPVAVVDGNRLLVFDIDASGERYGFSREIPNKFGLRKGIRASFPLQGYDNRTACIVSEEIFDEPGGYAIVFHEFMHCSQWQSCETRLKEGLAIYKKAIEANDYMWELNHPFPYGNERFKVIYPEFVQNLERGDSAAVASSRRLLKEILKPEDWEYLCWQEWKEGFARYIENLIRNRFKLAGNHTGLGSSLDRVCFYEGGSRFIAFLEKQEPGLVLDLEKLYGRIAGTVAAGSRCSDSAAVRKQGS